MAENYIRAFKQFSGAKEGEFEHKSRDKCAYFSWNGKTYIVVTEADLRREYKDYFDRESYDEIYTQIPSDAWGYMLQEDLDGHPLQDMFINIYRSWRNFWDNKRVRIEDEPHYEKLRSRSWEDLMILFEVSKLDRDEIVTGATDINDNDLVPIIAMAFKDMYAIEDEFYDDLVGHIVSRGKGLLTMGDTFEEIEVMEKNGGNCYYVYNPIIEFKNLD